MIATACDVDGCDTLVVVIDVTPVNDPPVAVDDAVTTDLNTPVVTSVMAMTVM